MLIGRHPKFFKFALVFIVALIFITVATRQRISNLGSEQWLFNNQRADLVKKVEQIIAYGQADNENINGNNTNETKNIEEFTEEDLQMPFDDRIPGAYLRFKEPAEINKSYCRYNYRLPYDLDYKGKINLTSPEQGKSTQYRIIYNVIEAHDTHNAIQVTYASHMTANFANFIPELLRYWDGLIVIAAFVPDLDAALFLEQINQYCYCEPDMYRVSIHIVTHKTVPISKKDIYFNRPDNCIPQDSSKIAVYSDFEETMVYPVNVLRNVARTSALTKYVLLSDIELMPSKGLAGGFLKMIEKSQRNNSKEVFVVPIFEIEESESIPENKKELLKLVKDKKAVYFHEIVCKHCQKFPGMEKWMLNRYSDEVEPLATVKRHTPYNRWEPLFIGTNKEPLYSEKLSWEGLQDKMTQSLEMCLMDYNYTILDNAFLCHWPGIKKQKVVFEDWRVNFVLENKVEYREIVRGLQKKYVDIPGCLVNDTSAVLPTKKNSRPLF